MCIFLDENNTATLSGPRYAQVNDTVEFELNSVFLVLINNLSTLFCV